MEVVLQSENGILGMGPYPTEARSTRSHHAGKETVTVVPARRFFSSADSFAMIRGGHIDLCILVRCSGREGSLANWMIRPPREGDGRRDGPRRGGAPRRRDDGARRQSGEKKILKRCTTAADRSSLRPPDHHPISPSST